MNDQNKNGITEEQLRQAADWHARTSGPDMTKAEWEAFTAWLEADVRNSRAYDQVEDMSNQIDDLSDDLHIHLEAQTSSTVINAGWRWNRQSRWVGGLMAVAAMLIAMVGIGLFSPEQAQWQLYETGSGERLEIALDDGSVVQLNTESRLRVRYSDTFRETELDAGEAFFNVSSDKSRPFLVTVGTQAVTVVGTRFNILRHRHQLVVTVREGLVDVAPKEAAVEAVTPKRLGQGDQLTHDETANATTITTVDTDRVLSWQDGYLEYENARLEDIVADLNRYFQKPVQIYGRAKDLTFSGILHMDDREAVLTLLETLLPINISRTDREIIIRAKE